MGPATRFMFSNKTFRTKSAGPVPLVHLTRLCLGLTRYRTGMNNTGLTGTLTGLGRIHSHTNIPAAAAMPRRDGLVRVVRGRQFVRF